MATNPLQALGIKVGEPVSGRVELTAPGGTTATVDAKALKGMGEQFAQLVGSGATVARGYASQLMGSSKDVRLGRASNFAEGLCSLAKTLGLPFVADLFGSHCKSPINSCRNDRSLQQGGK